MVCNLQLWATSIPVVDRTLQSWCRWTRRWSRHGTERLATLAKLRMISSFQRLKNQISQKFLVRDVNIHSKQLSAGDFIYSELFCNIRQLSCDVTVTSFVFTSDIDDMYIYIYIKMCWLINHNKVGPCSCVWQSWIQDIMLTNCYWQAAEA